MSFRGFFHIFLVNLVYQNEKKMLRRERERDRELERSSDAMYFSVYKTFFRLRDPRRYKKKEEEKSRRLFRVYF
ncbi:hypothetical protein RNJ44_01662 [Nakaseomyces bracarensis]|uniref:Uncharacterized protein n=1 Tax=Nakaseomyces bracarensis TaxID=273131 RepID=A0ABR4NNF1_9SACH